MAKEGQKESLQIAEYHDLQVGSRHFHIETLQSLLFVNVLLLAFFIVLNIKLCSKHALRGGSKLQTVAELLVDFVRDMVVTEGGEKARKYAFIVGTLFVFIFACNYLALVPWSTLYEFLFAKSFGPLHEIIPPTMDINTTITLALFTVGIVHLIGIKERGLKHFGHLFVFKVLPNPFAVMEELARPFSLCVRLFANLLAHETIVAVLLWLTAFPIVYPVPIIMLGMITGLIQAYVFSLLATNYLAGALQEHH